MNNITVPVSEVLKLKKKIDKINTQCQRHNLKDKCTTDADIRYFETTAYYRAEALEAWREDHYGSSEGFNEAYGS